MTDHTALIDALERADGPSRGYFFRDYAIVPWDSSIEARFFSLVEKTESGCWEWRGQRSPKGYGQFCIGNKRYAAHRLLFVKTGNPLALNQHCDHLCRNRGCVNPAHVEAVSCSENVRRGDASILNRLRGAAKTHCAQGHEYTASNTYKDKRGRRSCKACNHARRNEARRAKARAKAVQP